MMKLLLTGIWVCVVTLGTVYASVYMATRPPVDEEALRKDKLQLVKGESITVPMISNGAVTGYFLGRISFMMDKEKIKNVELPMTELMTDELFTLLVGNKMIDIANTGAFDVAAFREAIKTDMNKRLGEGFVEEVLVEQLDYLAKQDTRTGDASSAPPPKPVTIVEGQPVEAPAASAGH
ncbi:flagellar basal body-associated FliL family protein [Rhizobium sp. RU36D]|uniref:flagellar basal body-associated FliL family protein n=1 Tax=Rhizobium sp. RU36D TaxID=1907415 RepID=UPI0009D909D6|nr:flagellar basal body-associated FliL family protein [Rhizobium sp. RU36D]SMC84874.1 hypothetical protein SAMN05880593_10850 [Rhizobium sp. RU36D]